MSSLIRSHKIDLRSEPDVFGDNYVPPASHWTIKHRRQHCLALATALVRSSIAPDKITSLAVLVDVRNARTALRFHLERAGGKPSGYLYQLATVIKTVARHHVQVGPEHLEQLRSLCRAFKPKTSGLTEKNRRCLRQFADGRNLAALLMLPQKLLRQARRDARGRRHEAVRVSLGLAIAVELAIPIRADNLAGLRIDRHIHRVGDKVFLVIPPEKTKNRNAVEAELPQDVVELLDVYLREFRPRLVPLPCPWLFPGEAGGRRVAGGFDSQIGDLIRRETGITMTLHQFRHLAAKLYLDRRPGEFETVRRLLAHKSLSTTMRFYHELDAVVATRRYGEVVTQLLAEAQSRVGAKGRTKRRKGERHA